MLSKEKKLFVLEVILMPKIVYFDKDSRKLSKINSAQYDNTIFLAKELNINLGAIDRRICRLSSFI